MARDPIPTGRVRRTATVAGLVGGQAARTAVMRAFNVVRTRDRRLDAVDRRYVEAAAQIVEVLGSMKGAAMKVGQVLSFLEVSAVPPEYRDVVQEALAQLRDAAPTVPFEDMRRVNLPRDHVFAQRMAGLTVAVLGQLEATANWHGIVREFLYGDPPQTALGRQEAEFFGRRAPAQPGA